MSFSKNILSTLLTSQVALTSHVSDTDTGTIHWTLVSEWCLLFLFFYFYFFRISNTAPTRHGYGCSLLRRSADQSLTLNNFLRHQARASVTFVFFLSSLFSFWCKGLGFVKTKMTAFFFFVFFITQFCLLVTLVGFELATTNV